jgi:hypothetical protein
MLILLFDNYGTHEWGRPMPSLIQTFAEPFKVKDDRSYKIDRGHPRVNNKQYFNSLIRVEPDCSINNISIPK